MNVVIVDYGLGNVRSIAKRFERLGIEANLGATSEEIAKASHLVLPGVGNFKTAMENLISRDMIKVLRTKVIDEGTPALGICLGFQLLFEHSAEGQVDGLGWIPGSVVRFQFEEQQGLRCPHVGWNKVQHKGSRLFTNIPEDTRFYFTHSYYVPLSERRGVEAKTNYGFDFVSAIESGSIFGTQFHPEKSHSQGLEIFKNFVEFNR